MKFKTINVTLKGLTPLLMNRCDPERLVKKQTTVKKTYLAEEDELEGVASSSQRVSTGYKPIIAAAGALTIALWLKAASGATGVIVGAGKNVTGGWNRVQLNFQATDKVRIYARDDALNILSYTSVKTIADNSWHHVVAVVDPGKDLVQLYVDGAFDGQTSGTLGQISCDAFDFNIGCLNNQGAYSSYITGFVDEVAFYEKTLTAAETLELFRRDPPSGVSRVGCGAWAMIYLAAEPESLVHNLIRVNKVEGESRVSQELAYG